MKQNKEGKCRSGVGKPDRKGRKGVTWIFGRRLFQAKEKSCHVESTVKSHCSWSEWGREGSGEEDVRGLGGPRRGAWAFIWVVDRCHPEGLVNYLHPPRPLALLYPHLWGRSLASGGPHSSVWMSEVLSVCSVTNHLWLLLWFAHRAGLPEYSWLVQEIMYFSSWWNFTSLDSL